jgi:hypothetical protein
MGYVCGTCLPGLTLWSCLHLACAPSFVSFFSLQKALAEGRRHQRRRCGDGVRYCVSNLLNLPWKLCQLSWLLLRWCLWVRQRGVGFICQRSLHCTTGVAAWSDAADPGMAGRNLALLVQEFCLLAVGAEAAARSVYAAAFVESRTYVCCEVGLLW